MEKIFQFLANHIPEIISFFSLAFSIFSFSSSKKSNKEINDLKIKILKIEIQKSKKANISMTSEKSKSLTFTNIGEGTAHNFTMQFDNVFLSLITDKTQFLKQFPKDLKKNESVKIKYYLTSSDYINVPAITKVTMNWINENGTQEEEIKERILL